MMIFEVDKRVDGQRSVDKFRLTRCTKSQKCEFGLSTQNFG